ncbi:hypothetical protein AB0I07_30870, partial [Polymorphospora rubra]
YGADDVILLVKTATETPPSPAGRWTMEALARWMNEAGVAISASQVWRICQGLDLKPWQYESWMTSHDPDFWVKAADVLPRGHDTAARYDTPFTVFDMPDPFPPVAVTYTTPRWSSGPWSS